MLVPKDYPYFQLHVLIRMEEIAQDIYGLVRIRDILGLESPAKKVVGCVEQVILTVLLIFNLLLRTI